MHIGFKNCYYGHAVWLQKAGWSLCDTNWLLERLIQRRIPGKEKLPVLASTDLVCFCKAADMFPQTGESTKNGQNGSGYVPTYESGHMTYLLSTHATSRLSVFCPNFLKRSIVSM